jgi:hypothetical protein
MTWQWGRPVVAKQARAKRQLNCLPNAHQLSLQVQEAWGALLAMRCAPCLCVQRGRTLFFWLTAGELATCMHSTCRQNCLLWQGCPWRGAKEGRVCSLTLSSPLSTQCLVSTCLQQELLGCGGAYEKK